MITLPKFVNLKEMIIIKFDNTDNFHNYPLICIHKKDYDLFKITLNQYKKNKKEYYNFYGFICNLK